METPTYYFYYPQYFVMKMPSKQVRNQGTLFIDANQVILNSWTFQGKEGNLVTLRTDTFLYGDVCS